MCCELTPYHMIPMARPTDYNDALGERICSNIADGESLRSICRDEDYPDRATVFRWLAIPDHIWFRDQCALAREASADADDRTPPHGDVEAVCFSAGCPMPAQRSICSEISNPSSTSMPRYLTVLSSFPWPSRSWQGRRFPVFL